MTSQQGTRGAGGTCGLRVPGLAPRNGRFEDSVGSRKDTSPGMSGVYRDHNELHRRNTHDSAYNHDSGADDVPDHPQQESMEATRNEEHKQKCAAKNARIEALKFDVEKTRHEDLQLQADTRQGEEKLARMKEELNRLQPQQEREQPTEFYMRPAKVKKGKKK